MKDQVTNLSSRFSEAFLYAFQLHAQQVRKGTHIPYVAHLMSVTALVLEAGGSEDEAIAALLHDAVEDQGGLRTLAEIRARFGDLVASIVEGCTDATVHPKPAWQKRKEDYIAHLVDASPEVRRVSLADKIHNARSILQDLRESGSSIFSKFNGDKNGTLWYYSRLAEVFKQVETNYWVDELIRLVDQIQTLAGKPE